MKYLRKIRSKLIERLLKAFVEVALRLNSPSLFAWACVFFARSMNPSIKRGKILLVHESRGGIKDIEAMISLYGFPTRVIALPFWVSKRAMSHFFGYEVQDYEFPDLSLYDNAAYNSFIAKVYQRLKDRFHVIGVINFNYSYVSQRVPMRICRDITLPFITVMKESFKTAGMFEGYEEIYRKIIKLVEPAAVMFQNYSELEVFNRVFNKSGEIKTKVVGVPRMDLLFKAQAKTEQMIQTKPVREILFMMVGTYSGLPSVNGRVLGKDEVTLKGFPGYDHINESVLEVLCEIASQNDNVRVTAKLKGFENPSITEERSAKFPNIEFDSGEMKPHLMIASDAVIAFNSTSLAEAAVLGKIIVSPEIQIDRTLLSEYLFDLSSFAFVATSKAALRSILVELISQGRRPDGYLNGARDFIDELTHNSDGKSGLRLKEALESELGL